MTKALELEMINICIYIYSLGKGTMGNGKRTFTNVSGEKGHFILWETGYSTLWERFSGEIPLGNVRTTYPLGFWTSSGKRNTLFSAIWTTYPLGDILWESGIWESVFNPLYVCLYTTVTDSCNK